MTTRDSADDQLGEASVQEIACEHNTVDDTTQDRDPLSHGGKYREMSGNCLLAV